jgi:S1-C subfamily serine protease
VVVALGTIIGIDNDGRWLTDAGLTRGMSGGPVFNRSGAVVGIVASGSKLIPISFSKSLLTSG